MKRTLIGAAIAVSALLTSTQVDAALARPPVVQRDTNGRGVIDVSGDGRFALTGDPTMGAADRRVNLSTNARMALSFQALNAQILDDGSAMVFVSFQKLIPSDTNGGWDIYRYTFATKKFVRIVLSAKPANWEFALADVSGNGNVLGLSGSNTASGLSSVWLYDIAGKKWRRPDSLFPASPNPHQSQDVRLSSNGRVAAWVTYNGFGCTKCSQVWAYNWTTNSKKVVSVRSTGLALNDGNAVMPSISPDGTVVSFVSNASHIVAGYNTVKQRVYVRNLVTKATKMMSEKVSAIASSPPQLGGGGKVLVLLEDRPTKVGSSTQKLPQPVVYYVATKANVMLDQPAGAALPNGYTRTVMVSSIAKKAVFTTTTKNFTTVVSPSVVTDRMFASSLA
jgi:hypothetical protein